MKVIITYGDFFAKSKGSNIPAFEQFSLTSQILSIWVFADWKFPGIENLWKISKLNLPKIFQNSLVLKMVKVVLQSSRDKI